MSVSRTTDPSGSQGFGGREPDYAVRHGLPRGSDCPAGRATRPQNVGQLERLGSMVGGSMLLLGALKRGNGSLLSALLGGSLLYRGLTGHCHGYELLGINTAEHPPATAVPGQEGVKIEKTITIQRSPEQLYAYWRKLENLPRVMRHLESVEVLDNRRSRWVASGPAGLSVAWQAEVINERQNEMIAWRSLPGGDIDTAGSVRFKSLGAAGGTEVTVSLKYNPPAGKAGHWLATLLGQGLEQELDEDMGRLKSVMESRVPTAASTNP